MNSDTNPLSHSCCYGKKGKMFFWVIEQGFIKNKFDSGKYYEAPILRFQLDDNLFALSIIPINHSLVVIKVYIN